MNWKAYNIIGFFLGSHFKEKANYLYRMPTVKIEGLSETGMYYVLMDWVKANPKQVLSLKVAEELMAKARK
jgi:hypothetical protein